MSPADHLLRPQVLLGRLNSARERLATLATDEGSRQPGALTEPDESTGERWDVGQAWAHLAEFPSFWLDQIRRVLERSLPEPVSFGRVKSDPGRIEAIEGGRARPIRELHAEMERGLDDVRAYLGSLDDASWEARGTHPTRGEMRVAEIVERFIVTHLEEHVAQLEALVAD